MQLTESSSKSIIELLPHIFRRPVLSVSPTDSLLQTGTFLAIGPQIYVDGLVILEEKRPVGRVGGQHLIKYILEHQDALFNARASDIMCKDGFEVKGSDSFHSALDIFEKSRFAFVPIVADDGSIATSLSVRDALRLAIGKLCTPVEEISSKLISVKNGTSIEGALKLMLDEGIRNLAVKSENGQIQVINDRKILEFLLSYEGRKLAARPLGLDSVSLEFLEMPYARNIKSSMPAGNAAELLSDVNTTCLISGNSIITPWDIVMKGICGVC